MIIVLYVGGILCVWSVRTRECRQGANTLRTVRAAVYLARGRGLQTPVESERVESGALDGSRARAPGKVRRGGELRAPQSSEQMEKVDGAMRARERGGGRTSLLGRAHSRLTALGSRDW